MEPLLTFVLILSSANLPLSTSEDSITAVKPLTHNQTITSEGGNFALGFFTPQNSTNTYLGIWYNTIPTQTVIWVANRESPLPMNSTAVLTLKEDGNLVLFNERNELFWSTNVSRSSKLSVNSAVGVLLDTGNLELKHGDNEVKWQSFDHPTDTLMPDMKFSLNMTTGKGSRITSWKDYNDPQPGNISFDPKGLLAYLWKSQEPYWRTDVYPAPISFTNGYNISQNSAVYIKYFIGHDEMYFMFTVSINYVKFRATLVPSGKIELLLWVRNSWTNIWQMFPNSRCDLYRQCGSFSGCLPGVPLPLCQCLTGFEPKYQKDWANRKWGGGCVRSKALSCDRGDTFSKHQGMKLPDNAVLLGNISVEECRFQCFKNCSCTAYSYANLTQDGVIVRCLNWFGELEDIQYQYITGLDLYVRLHGYEIADNGNGKLNRRKKLAILATVVSTVSIGLFLISIFCYKQKRNIKKFKEMNQKISEQTDSELLRFSLREVLSATDSFSEAKKLGEGGFGPVYKGSMQECGEVAIKRLSKKSSQGFDEFVNEMKLIAKLQHRNLVRLLGCCVEDEENILVYEYMPNRSLDKFLFDPSEQAKLQWSQRFRIIEGIAQGLLYLHTYSRLRVIHRDLKASNILLDQAMTPRISDFGMARNFGIDQTEATTQRVVGTYGYMPPEYVIQGQFSEKSDVFSFGVLLLEIVSGKRNTSFYNNKYASSLLEWTWENWSEGRGSELIDPSIKDMCDNSKAMKCISVGLLCVEEGASERPTMSEVVVMLGNENAVIPSPGQPAFTTRAQSKEAASSSPQKTCTKNELTITNLDPR